PAPRARRGRDRRRLRSSREPDAGDRPQGARQRGRRGGRGPGDLRDRGDEDGERDRGSAGRRRHRARGGFRAGHHERSADLCRRGRWMTGEGADLATLVRRLVDDGALTGASLSRARRGGPSRPSRVTVAPVLLGDGLRYRFTSHRASRSTDENVTPEAAAERLVGLLETEFRQGVLQSPEADWQVLVGGEKEPRILRRPPSR